MSVVWLALFLFLGLVPNAESATINASSCSQANVSSAINSASDGDTVRVPGGTCTWNPGIIVSGKSISIIGAGAGTETQCGVGGQATFTCISSTSSPIFQATTKATGNTPAGFFRVSGITFEAESGMSGCQTYGSAMVHFFGTSGNVRFDHNTVISRSCGGLIVDGYVRGVGDHNSFDLRSSGSHTVIIMHESWGTASGNHGDCSAENVCGDQSWSSPTTFGTPDAFYMEDNTYTQTLGDLQWQVDDNHGGRAVHRFNTTTNGVFHQHGTESNGRARGLMQWEIYRNRHIWTIGQTPSMIASRGGTGIVFDNVATGAMNSVVSLQTQRANTDKNYYPWSACGRWAVTSLTRSGSTVNVTHTGPSYTIGSASYVQIEGATPNTYNGIWTATKTGANSFTFQISGSPGSPATGTIIIKSPFDGNTGGGTGADAGYPCIDQVGRGTAAVDPNGYGPGNGDISNIQPLNNALQPYYIFNNKDDGNQSPPSNETPSVQVENRDFYVYTQSFNGTVGIGRGPRSSRPSNCTTGVAWWATDQGSWNTSTTETYSFTPGEDGVLDKCIAPNTWQDAWYTPFTYPHPLTKVGTGGDATPPAAPTGLQIS